MSWWTALVQNIAIIGKLICKLISYQAPQPDQQWLHWAHWCPAPAPPNNSHVPVGSAFTWTADVTCRRTVWMDRMRKTAVRYMLTSRLVIRQNKTCKYFVTPFFSSLLVDCIMSTWTAWSACSVSCGLGSLFRQRDILREALPGGACGGAQFDSRACFPRACPGPFS